MIQSLHSLTLSVPDLEVGKAFYTCMGLTCRREDQAYVFQCDGRDQDQLRLIKGPKKNSVDDLDHPSKGICTNFKNAHG